MNIVVMQERHLAALAEIERACFHAPWSENMLREELGKGIFLRYCRCFSSICSQQFTGRSYLCKKPALYFDHQVDSRRRYL